MENKKLKNNKVKYNREIVKKIFHDVEIELKNKLGLIHMAINKDNENFLESYQYMKILENIQCIDREEWTMELSDTKVRYDGIGNIAVVFNGNPNLATYFILKALKTNNNILLYTEDGKKNNTVDLITNLISNICKKNNYNTQIEYNTYKSVKELNPDIDKYFFINKYSEYLELRSKNPEINATYSSFGTMSLYMDNSELRDSLLKLDEYVFNNNIELELLSDMSVENAIEKINSNPDNYCAIIFTKDKKKAYKFIENVQAKQIFINKNPEQEYKFYIDDIELMVKKELYLI